MNQEQFADNIRNWAEARDLLSLDGIAQQGMYLIAEIGEAVSEYLKGNMPAMMVELGDVLVVLQVMRLQAGIECPGEPALGYRNEEDVPLVLRDLTKHILSAAKSTDVYRHFANHYSDQIRNEEKSNFADVLRWVHLDTCQALHEIGYTPAQARQAVWEKIANRTGKTANGVFIKDAPSPELGWIPTAERPLVQPTPSGGWITTEDGDDDFLAAVPYQDANYPAQDLWWIKHCVIEESGLCIVGEDYNEPAGWDVDAVDYFLPITPPSPKS